MSSSVRRSAGQSFRSKHVGDERDQARRRQLAGREVDGDDERVDTGSVGPRAGLADGLLEHPLADPHDQPGLLGHADELRRQHQPSFGVLPAQQRLDADDLARAERDLRLVVQRQLGALDRLAQLAIDAEQFGGVRLRQAPHRDRRRRLHRLEHRAGRAGEGRRRRPRRGGQRHHPRCARDALSVARGRQEDKPGWAKKFREHKTFATGNRMKGSRKYATARVSTK